MAEKYTLKESVEALHRLTGIVADLLSVVVIDCQDEWGDGEIPSRIFSERLDTGADRTTEYAGHFARMLVTRLLYEEDLRIELITVDRHEEADRG